MSTATTTQQSSSFAHIQTDPLRNYKFQVLIHHGGLDSATRVPQMGFMSVSGLSITTDVIVYRQGGMNTTTQKMPKNWALAA